MSFSESIKICLHKYMDFNGRASRSEYWWFVLLTFLLGFIPIIGWILRLVLLLPSLAVQVRRLHDIERSAWWLLLLVPPITPIGLLILMIMSIFSGTTGYNRYGPDPLQGAPGFRYGRPDDLYAPSGYYTPTTEYEPGSYGSQASPTQAVLGQTVQEAEVQRRFCTQCGAQLHAEARFCNICGTPI